jgi:uncharacterized membrane protein
MEKKELKHPVFKIERTLGQKAADKLTTFAGSWTFIILLLIFLGIWMAVNVLMVIYRWDPYPFILLNLILSCLAAIQAPIILMSQNREAQRDRLRAEYDFRINKKAEREIQDMQKDLEEIKEMIKRK